jgi:hypothetical protein
MCAFRTVRLRHAWHNVPLSQPARLSPRRCVCARRGLRACCAGPWPLDRLICVSDAKPTPRRARPLAAPSTSRPLCLRLGLSVIVRVQGIALRPQPLPAHSAQRARPSAAWSASWPLCTGLNCPVRVPHTMPAPQPPCPLPGRCNCAQPGPRACCAGPQPCTPTFCPRCALTVVPAFWPPHPHPGCQARVLTTASVFCAMCSGQIARACPCSTCTVCPQLGLRFGCVIHVPDVVLAFRPRGLHPSRHACTLWALL